MKLCVQSNIVVFQSSSAAHSLTDSTARSVCAATPELLQPFPNTHVCAFSYHIPLWQPHRKLRTRQSQHPQRNIAPPSYRLVANRRRKCVSNSLDPALQRSLRHLEQISSMQPLEPSPGEVYLVGTGPGDPRFLTLAAVELLQLADVVLYDRLVSDQILSFVNEGAEKICVGKARGVGTGTQPAIQEQLAHHAARGKRVVRLKGGDPAIFGRLGDELGYLRQEHGIKVHVVPGVTTASAVAACLGFPLTQNGMADSVRLLTGHIGEDGEFDAGDFGEGITIVVYMGLREIDGLLAKLIKRGARSDLPAVAVQSVSTSKQKVVWGRLEDLGRAVGEANLQSPVLIVIGEVVQLARDWPHA